MNMLRTVLASLVIIACVFVILSFAFFYASFSLPFFITGKIIIIAGSLAFTIK